MFKSLKGKNVFRISFALALLFAIVVPSTISAAENNKYGYGFVIYPYQQNSRVGDGSAKYRSTSSIENSWKVQMTYSNESADSKTVSTYWLEGTNGENVTPSVNVKEDAPAYYKQAYDSASRRTVYLTVQNNNFDNNTYEVGGNWDEETGIYIR